MTALRGDTVNTQLLGMNKVISDSSAIRALKRMNEAQAIEWLHVVDDNSSSLDEKKRLTQRQEIISVSSQVHQL
jgi:hypothetical protein